MKKKVRKENEERGKGGEEEKEKGTEKKGGREGEEGQQPAIEGRSDDLRAAVKKGEKGREGQQHENTTVEKRVEGRDKTSASEGGR
ncbi:hypothetical protein OIV68_33435 [Burkholderia pseudomallei]|uniref:hypothetical protein n=1 Tax=Burkholderia pseudomallei TaxID=28450 RepID=UPI0021F6A7DA|nr:hypothetical protein [Burkholderia pseudomallei]MCW0073005.1 hypothetical protein [Burkholderia pseudomallei]